MDTLEYYESNKEFNVFVASTYSDLALFKEQDERALFNDLLLNNLYQVKKYTAKRLVIALSKGTLPKGKYKVDDFIDQLFIVVYNDFNQIQTAENLHPWLFKKVDELLEESIVDEEFDDQFLKNIDDYSKPEWDEMEEKYSIDAGGDLVMIDELDDISYPKNDYALNHVFIENDQKEFFKKLDKDLSDESKRKHTNMVLYYLPLPVRAVFELAAEYQFSLTDIATIRNQSLEEVKELLEIARKSIEASFLNRFDTKD